MAWAEQQPLEETWRTSNDPHKRPGSLGEGKKPCRPKRRAVLTEPATASTHTADTDVTVGLRPRGLPHEAQRGPSRSRSRLDDQRCAGHPITRRRNALSPVLGPLPARTDEPNRLQGPPLTGSGEEGHARPGQPANQVRTNHTRAAMVSGKVSGDGDCRSTEAHRPRVWSATSREIRGGRSSGVSGKFAC